MRLFGACALTVLIETMLFILCGIRSRNGITAVICANIVTNLAMNLSFRLFLPFTPLSAAAAEILVTAAEYAIYTRVFGASRRLLPVTALANALSCGAGVLLF